MIGVCFGPSIASYIHYIVAISRVYQNMVYLVSSRAVIIHVCLCIRLGGNMADFTLNAFDDARSITLVPLSFDVTCRLWILATEYTISISYQVIAACRASKKMSFMSSCDSSVGA